MAWKDFNRKGVGRIVNAGGKTSTFAQNQFEMQLKEFTDQYLPQQQVLFVKKVSRKILVKLINKSPTKTGRFRGAWMVGINGANRDEPNTPDKYSKGVSNVSYQRARDIISSLQPGDSVYISNNLDYALMLEYGWSKQAPQGMVAVSLNEIDAWLQGQKKTTVEAMREGE